MEISSVITASSVDSDATQNTITYQLVNSAGGRFAIESTTGVITVANSSLLDHNVSSSHTIRVRASSEDGSVADTDFVIAVQGNLAPTEIQLVPLTVFENTSTTLAIFFRATCCGRSRRRRFAYI